MFTWIKRKIAEFLWNSILEFPAEVRKLKRNDAYLFILPESATQEQITTFYEAMGRMVNGEYTIVVSDKINIIGFE